MQNRILSKFKEEDALISQSQEGGDPVLMEESPAVAEVLKSHPEEEQRSERDIYERYVRIYADFENYRKRTAKEMERLSRSSNEELIGEILPFIDNLERAMKYGSLKKNDSAWAFISGVQLAIKDLLHMLEKYGLQPMKAIGQSFDPNLHDAVSAIQSKAHPPNTVIDELRKGYLINNRLLRPSRVVVALAPDPVSIYGPESA